MSLRVTLFTKYKESFKIKVSLGVILLLSEFCDVSLCLQFTGNLIERPFMYLVAKWLFLTKDPSVRYSYDSLWFASTESLIHRLDDSLVPRLSLPLMSEREIRVSRGNLLMS